jgi:hypothetical protein
VFDGEVSRGVRSRTGIADLEGLRHQSQRRAVADQALADVEAGTYVPPKVAKARAEAERSAAQRSTLRAVDTHWRRDLDVNVQDGDVKHRAAAERTAAAAR